MELVGIGPEPIDVSGEHVPVSMRPLVLGVRLPAPTTAQRCTLVVRDVASGARLGQIALVPHGEVPLTGAALSLFRTTSCRNFMCPRSCAGDATRWRGSTRNVQRRAATASG